jgi:hypothetical protein
MNENIESCKFVLGVGHMDFEREDDPKKVRVKSR